MATVDARGLACPLPLTMAKQRMAELSEGEAMLVMATDPEAPIDLAAWAAENGHSYEERDARGWMEFVIRKGAR